MGDVEMNSLVSVVIPLHTSSKFLGDAVASVFNQEYRPIQLILVCSNCDANTIKIATRWAKTGEKGIDVEILTHETDIKLAGALRAGFDAAKGVFVAVLDPDDVWIHERKLNGQVAAMENTGANISFFKDYWQGTDIVDKKPIIQDMPPALQLMPLIFNNPIINSTVMFEKSWLDQNGSIDPKLGNFDPLGDLYMRHVMLGAEIICLHSPTILKRVHPGQFSKTNKDHIVGQELVRMRMIRLLIQKRRLIKHIQENPVTSVVVNVENGIHPFAKNHPIVVSCLATLLMKSISVDLFRSRLNINTLARMDQFNEDLSRLSNTSEFNQFRLKMMKNWGRYYKCRRRARK